MKWPTELKDFVDRHARLPNKACPRRTIRAYVYAKCEDGVLEYGKEKEVVTGPLYGHPMIVKQGE